MVCTKQFCSYRERAEDFAALTPRLSGFSRRIAPRTRDSPPSTRSTCPLLADVDMRVARDYSAFSARLGTKRAAIVIDEQGVLHDRHDHLLGLDYQSVDDLKAALDSLS